jgi:hypothetical protein
MPAVRLVVVFLLLICPLTVSAQSVADLHAGMRVRVQTERAGVLVGTVSAVSADSIRIVRGGETRAFSLAETKSVSTSTGPSSYRGVLRTGLASGLIGAAAGAGIGAMTYKPCESKGIFNCAYVPNSRPRATVFGAAAFGISSFVIGGVVGAIRGSDAWAPVALH